MLRTGDAIYGVALALLAMAGLATHAAPWFIVLNFLMACFTLFIAAYGRDRVAASGGTIAIAALLMAASVVAMSRFATGLWMYWAVLGVSCAALVLAVLSAFSRTDTQVPPHLLRTEPRVRR